MSHLPHIAQRHPWHQAVYALMALVSFEKARQPQKKPSKNANGVAPPDVAFWITFRTVFLLAAYGFFMPNFLRPFLFFVPFLLIGRWLSHMVPACGQIACGLSETLDTLAALINREYARHIDELGQVPDIPVSAEQSASSGERDGDDDEDERTMAENEANSSNPVEIAIEAQWQQLKKHMDANPARQHITLPADLLNQFEPLFVVNRERLLKHGYDCAQGHCFNQDCLLLVTSERKKQLRNGQHSHCNEPKCQCDGSWDCTLF